jgi:predicted RNA-binding Zn ribbon-like protein
MKPMVGHPGDIENSSAPGNLEVVRAFVNSYDAETGLEEWSSPDALAAWLAERNLGPANAELSEADVARAVELREALRQVLLGNNGVDLPAGTYKRLNAAIAGASLEVRFDDEGTAGLVPSGGGIDAAIGRIASTVGEAMSAGEWTRMKVCPADDCLWAFYDRSRNRSRTWCRMEDCGNRSKVRAFRERHSA